MSVPAYPLSWPIGWPRTPGLIERFWGKVDQRGPDECWPWTASKFKKGYGSFTLYHQISARAHRVAYILENGAIPAKQLVRHSCDNRACCNPRHLLLGTDRDNIDDRNQRGRTARGERANKSDLTTADVLAIRADKRSRRQIAAAYGLSKHAIDCIKNRITWRHVA